MSIETEYTVFVDDHAHYKDEPERRTLGTYSSYDAAVGAARKVVDKSLDHLYRKGMSATQWWDLYKVYGDDPFIVPENGKPAFSAWAYAEARCSALREKPTATFLEAEWRHLVMLNYEIDPAILQPLVPAGTELDTWNGHTFVSMVGFMFLNTRVQGMTIPFHVNFEEVNLRFYVRRTERDEVKRGVVFIKEIVPRSAIALVARVLYNENYVAHPMYSEIALPDESNGYKGEVAYGWKHHGRRNELRVQFEGKAAYAEADSEETFISEHYWGYAAQPDGSTLEYQVTHPQWRVWRATEAQFDCDVEGMYGGQFVEALSLPPHSAFVADGSAITVRKGKPLIL